MIKKYIFSCSIIACLFLCTACGDDEMDIDPREFVEMIHIGHPRMGNNSDFSKHITETDFSKYSVLMLGGDLAESTSADRNTIDSLDRIFNFADENTLWALGNHDYDDLDLVEEYTERPAYYSFKKFDITFIVLDSQDDLSSIKREQLEFFNSAINNLGDSKHLIVMTHKLIWMYGNEELESESDNIANGMIGDCFHCINPNNFYQDIYPKLKTVHASGVNVICLAGDLGFKRRSFEHITEDNIYFLANGLNGDAPDNEALIFNYEKNAASLSWTFELLDNL